MSSRSFFKRRINGMKYKGTRAAYRRRLGIFERLHERLCLSALYTFNETRDSEGNHEYRLNADSYHFASLTETCAGTVAFRGHPDRFDPDGWGTTEQENVFIAGDQVDATGGHVNAPLITAQGISLNAFGSVSSTAGSAGQWSWNSLITYDQSTQRIALNGTTSVTLNSAAAGDLNIGRLESNYLVNASLNTGGIGNTGDMRAMTFTYDTDSPIRQIQWTPTPSLPATSPGESSFKTGVRIDGNVNLSDPNRLAIRKPTSERTVAVVGTNDKIKAGGQWDALATGYQDDNAAGHQFLEIGANKNLSFQVSSTWTRSDSRTAGFEFFEAEMMTPSAGEGVTTAPRTPPKPQARTCEGESAGEGVTTADQTAFLMQRNGKIASTNTIPAGVYKAYVDAYSIESQGIGAKIQVAVAGATVGTPTTITGNNETFKSYALGNVEVEGGSTKVDVQFLNDDGPRDLIIDKVILQRLSDLPSNRTVVQAETMTVSPSTSGAPQGTYLLQRANGYASAYINLAAGVYQIEVLAVAQVSQNIGAQMQVDVAGVQAGPVTTVDKNNWSYKTYVLGNAEAEGGSTKLGIRFLNDDGPRDLYVDKIIARRLGNLPTNRTVVQAETMTVAPSTSGAPQGTYLLQWANGYASAYINLAAGVYQIEVLAVAQVSQNIGAQMQVDVAGVQAGPVTTVDKNNWSYKTYVLGNAEVEGGSTKLGIRFLNDDGPRDLYVDKIIARRLGNLPTNRTVVQAETMTVAPSTSGALQGTYLLQWANGYANTYINLAAGVYQIEVLAVAQVSQNIGAQMQVDVAGVQAGPVTTVDKNNWSYKTYVLGNAEVEGGSTKLGIRFLNDDGPRDLYVDKIIARRLGNLPTNRTVVQAETMTVAPSTSGAPQGTYLLQWANGYASAYINLAAGLYQIEVLAVAQVSQNIGAQMQVDVAGVQVGPVTTVDKNNWSYKTYVLGSAEVEGGSTKLGIRFVNDDGPRDLYVDKIIARRLGALRVAEPGQSNDGDKVTDRTSETVTQQSLEPVMERV